MPDYVSNIDLQEIAAMLSAGGRRVLITTHAKPDGDAFGSVVALAQALRQKGQAVDALLMPPVPTAFNELLGRELTGDHGPDMKIEPPDIVVIVDTGAWSQVAPMRCLLEPLTDRMIIIDHHLNGDIPAKHRYIDGQAAAACEIVAELIDALDVPFDAVISQALFVGITSDTGWFRFSNTRPATLELAARLKRQGVDQDALYAQLEQNDRPEKLQLLIRALDSLQLVADDQTGRQMAIMTLRSIDFDQTGAKLEETDTFVNMPLNVGLVDASALITEPPADSAGNGAGGESQPIRLSFRSKPRKGAINVARLAQGLGGGGHARAAGAKVDEPLDAVVERIKSVARSLHLHAE